MTSLFEPLRARARTLPATRTAIVHPMSADSLAAAIAAADARYIEPVLVGPQAGIERALDDSGAPVDRFEIVDAGADPLAAAHRAAALARDGAVQALMKGSLHTDEFMSAVLGAENGLRTRRRVSHVFLIAFPSHAKLLALTDAAVNIAPDLAAKADIARNAIELCRAVGIATPKVAVLAAIETVHPDMPATLHAAALAKMAQRGQIRHGVVDGPLAFDNAISARAARIKHIESPVAGDPDVLLAPDIECGNALYKQAVYLAGAEVGGLVVGATVPVVLTSRADSVQARVDSCVLAQLHAHWLRTTRGR